MSLFEKISGFFKFNKSEEKIIKEFTPADYGDVNRWETNRNEVNPDKGRMGDLIDYLKLYNNQPWVYVCVRDIANAASSVDYQLLSKGKEIEKPDPIYDLFKQPNPHETFTDFRRKIFTHLELTGNCFIELVRDDNDKLVGMFILRPDRISIMPHPKYKIAGFKYQIDNNGKEILFSTDEIIHLAYVDSKDEYWGMPPAMAAQLGITLNFYARAWNKNFFTQGAEPGGVLETDHSLSAQAYDRLLGVWMKRHRGPRNAHLPAILEEGMKYKAIVGKHSDMQFIEQQKATREEIYEVFDVPLNWRTDLNQKKSFYFSNIIPKLKWLAESINTTIDDPEKSGFDIDQFEIQFLTRSIEAMVEDEQIKAQIANSNVTHGIMTINEVRYRHWGLGPVEWGDDWWAPVGLMPTKSGQHPTNPGNVQGATVTDGYSAGLSSPTQVPNLNRESRLGNTQQNVPQSKSVEKLDEIKDAIEKQQKPIIVNIDNQLPEQKEVIQPQMPQQPIIVNIDNKMPTPEGMIEKPTKVGSEVIIIRDEKDGSILEQEERFLFNIDIEKIKDRNFPIGKRIKIIRDPQGYVVSKQEEDIYIGEENGRNESKSEEANS